MFYHDHRYTKLWGGEERIVPHEFNVRTLLFAAIVLFRWLLFHCQNTLIQTGGNLL
jgi:hypothetical protein